MNNAYQTYQCPYWVSAPRYNSNIVYNNYEAYLCPYCNNAQMYNADFNSQFPNQEIPFENEMRYASRFDYLQSAEKDGLIQLMDYGPEPFVVNIEEVTKQNNNFRTALWTGSYLQLTLMSINVGEDIGLEIHPDLDQFIRIEEGQGIVKMGDRKDNLDFQANVYDDFAFIIPAGKWHNLINTGNKPIKLYSIYAPPQHPRGTVHPTKAIAEASEGNHND